MWRDTAITRTLGIYAPIILGPFGANLSSEHLVALVSESGGLGIFGANALSPAAILDVAKRIRERTSKPFGLNLWVPMPDQPLSEPVGYLRSLDRLQPYFDALGLERPMPPARFSEDYEEQVEAVLEARPAVFSFVYGAPTKDILAQCRHRGIVTAGTATTVAEAEFLHAAGVDTIVVTGFEADTASRF